MRFTRDGRSHDTRRRSLLAALVVSAAVASTSGCMRLWSRLDRDGIDVRGQARCVDAGWHKLAPSVAGMRRTLLWKGPASWRNGAIIVLHGGGGTASDFCSGGPLVRPQILFAQMAIERGFAVFALDSTNDKVTDAEGRVCGKRFDFMVLERPNLDLPYLDEVVDHIIPESRPAGSSGAIFLTGLSTGGYMTIRAATHLGGRITAFAPISAGDPYGTHSNCDPSLSPRKSAKGVLVDNETGEKINEDDACRSSSDLHEAPWPHAAQRPGPPFRQFQDRRDGLVDFSCMEKAREMLARHGYADRGAHVIGADGRKSIWKHLWQTDYNAPLLDFLKAEGERRAR